MVLLSAEPGSPWPEAWTDAQCSALPTACPHATIFPHSPSQWGTSLLSTPTPFTREGVLYMGGWGRGGVNRGSGSVWARVLSEDS